MQSFDSQTTFSADQFLLRAVAEELKLPLTRIARLAELSYLVNDPEAITAQLRAIEHNSDVAMRLVESYLIGLQLANTQQPLDLEPISIGSILNDTAHQLSGIAGEYGVDMEVLIHGRQRLVMGNLKGVAAAFLNMGSTLIASQPQASRRSTITLASYPYRSEMVAGIYGDQALISPKIWERGLDLYGKARQPIQSLNATNGAGLFVADTIFRAMSSRLRPSHHRKQGGLAASLTLSNQLQLV